MEHVVTEHAQFSSYLVRLRVHMYMYTYNYARGPWTYVFTSNHDACVYNQILLRVNSNKDSKNDELVSGIESLHSKAHHINLQRCFD